MRNRTLSNDGMYLYLNGVVNDRPRNWAQKLIYNLFHSDYDVRLEGVVHECRESTKALCAKFNSENIHMKIDSGILHTIRLILTRDNKKIKKRHVEKSFRFFLDVMRVAFDQNDNQTAHMMYLALTHPTMTKLDIKIPKRASSLFEKMHNKSPK